MLQPKQEFNEEMIGFADHTNFFAGLPNHFDVGILNWQELSDPLSKTEENIEVKPFNPPLDVSDLDVKVPPLTSDPSVLTREEASVENIAMEHYYSASDVSNSVKLPLLASDLPVVTTAGEDDADETLQIFDVLMDESTDTSTYFRMLHSPSFQVILKQAENLIQNVTEDDNDILRDVVEAISYAIQVFPLDESALSKLLSPAELDRINIELKLKCGQLDGLQLKYYEMWEMKASTDEKLIAERERLAELELQVEHSRVRISELEREVAELQSNNQETANHLTMLEKVNLTSRASDTQMRLCVHLKLLRRRFART